MLPYYYYILCMY